MLLYVMYLLFASNALGVLRHPVPQTKDANYSTRKESEDIGSRKKFEQN